MNKGQRFGADDCYTAARHIDQQADELREARRLFMELLPFAEVLVNVDAIREFLARTSRHDQTMLDANMETSRASRARRSGGGAGRRVV